LVHSDEAFEVFLSDLYDLDVDLVLRGKQLLALWVDERLGRRNGEKGIMAG